MNKTQRITIVIEPLLGQAFERLSAKEGQSVSGKIRRMIINDLGEKGALPAEVSLEVLTRPD